MVVRDFDFVGMTILPAKADSELPVDPDAELPPTIAFQAFQAVSWWIYKIPNIFSTLELVQFSPGQGPKRLRAAPSRIRGIGSPEDVAGPSISE